MGTIETAKEAERSVVDIETLQHTNQQLIATLDEVMQIQKDGAQKRKEAELELGRIEGVIETEIIGVERIMSSARSPVQRVRPGEAEQWRAIFRRQVEKSDMQLLTPRSRSC